MTLVFSVLAMTAVSKQNIPVASNYLLVIFLVIGLSRLVAYLQDRTFINLLSFIIMFIINATLGVLVYYGQFNFYLYTLGGGLFCVGIVASCALRIVNDHRVRNIVFNVLVMALAIFLAIGLFTPSNNAEEPILLLCVVIIISAFIEVLSFTTSQLKLKVLAKIIIRTYALEIILGLATMMVAAALLFPLYEPNIKTFGDGLWFCFTIVTTIGFGDYTAVTPVGRGLTVLLGVYGIIVVAVLTSIIVNFYNETSAGKKDKSELKEINEEEKQAKRKKKK